jgi:ABC-type branched-subunit amino acid transport system substrate-binding protein
MARQRITARRWSGRALRIVAVVGISSVLAAACSSSGGSGSSASGSGSSASGGTVTVMVLGSLQSQAVSVPGIQYGVTAGADELNAAHGLGGHKINVIACNDQLEINLATACAREAVTDKVLAVVGSLTIYGNAVIPVLAAAGIPDIAPFPLSPLETSSSDSFPIQGGNLMESRGIAQSMKLAGAKTVNQVEVDSVAGHTSAQEVQQALTARGIVVKKTIYVPQTTSDMSAAVRASTTGGVTGITTNLANTQVVPLLISAKQQGITQPIAFSSTILSPTILQQAGTNADGALAAGSFPALTATNIPAIKQYVETMHKYQPGKPLDDYSLNGWAGMQFLKLAAGNLKNLTSATLIAAMNRIRNVPFLWIKSFSTTPNPTPGFSRIFNTTVFLEKVVDGNFVQQGNPVILNN